jgi:hypothetical protein
VDITDIGYGNKLLTGIVNWRRRFNTSMNFETEFTDIAEFRRN